MHSLMGDGVTDTTVATAKRGRVASGWHALRTSIFWTALRRQSSWLVATFILAIATAAVTALTAQAAAAVVDRGIVEQTDPLGGLVARLIVLALVELVVGAALRVVSERIAWTLDLDLRNVLYLRLQRATPRELDRFPTGQVVTRSLADLESLQNFIQIIQLQIFVVPSSWA